MEIRKEKLHPFFLKTLYESLPILGIRDSEIIDYIADLLARFVRIENLYLIRDTSGKRISTVVELLIQSRLAAGGDSPNILWEREIKKHLGDYTLFMLGIFKEYVMRLKVPELYEIEGKKAYRDVWEYDRRLFRPGARRFKELSDNFVMYAGALYFVRKTRWNFASTSKKDPFDTFLEDLEAALLRNSKQN